MHKIPVVFLTQNFMLSAIPMGTRVRVYWNLHKDCYSVQAKVGKTWKVACHVYRPFILSNITFSVNEKARQKVIANKRKEVHAYVVGNITDSFTSLSDLVGSRVTYNPYKYASFVHKLSEKPIKEAKAIFLSFVAKGDKRVAELTV